MNRVIVTGANGFIGSSLIKKLVQKGIAVTAIDVSFKLPRIPDSDLVHKIEMALNDAEHLIKAIPPAEYDALYHFAWQGVNGADKADPSVQVGNIQMAVNCAIAAKAIGCKKFLCAGTIAERAVGSLSALEKTSGGMMYGAAKHCAHLIIETYCKNIGLDFVWMQFSNIYGPNNATGNLVSYTLTELRNNREATFGPAMQPYDFIFVDDLIEAVLRLGINQTSQNFYFIGSGTPRILKEYLLEIGRQCGKEALVKTGVRPDDGIIYTIEMFDIAPLVSDIGCYVTKTFEEGILCTIEGANQ